MAPNPATIDTEATIQEAMKRGITPKNSKMIRVKHAKLAIAQSAHANIAALRDLKNSWQLDHAPSKAEQISITGKAGIV